ncbi:MAG: chorismate-binding protein [Bacteroidia bacterium]|nr:chorismate-binding protein [Bacteroidia bacterium]
MQASNSASVQPITERNLLPHLLNKYLIQGSAISLWRLPDSNEKHLLVSTDGVKILEDVILEDSESGFIFCPFDKARPKLFLKGDLIFSFNNGELSEHSKSIVDPSEIANEQSNAQKKPTYFLCKDNLIPSTEKNDYTTLVEKCLKGIAEDLFEKIVPSRSLSFALPAGFDPLTTFHNLCETYPNAFVSLVSTSETGTWLGATPELMVSVNSNLKFKTVALAGTKVFQQGTDLKSVAWTQKDIEEQAMVSRYIINCFKKIRLREYVEHGPRTAVAGNLIHLKTDYEVDMLATNFPQLGSVMLSLLHPTSAVCGMPLENTLQFLTQNEGYDREFYSGYLGPVNFKNESNIFVNLRCMQVQKTIGWCYAGAGITVDSEPEQEWMETEMKMNTLLSVINP